MLISVTLDHERARQLIKAGKHGAARLMLTEALREDANDATAWWYLAQCVEGKPRVRCLKNVLALAPEHTPARRALKDMRPMWRRPTVLLAGFFFGLVLPAVTIAALLWYFGGLGASAAAAHAEEPDPTLSVPPVEVSSSYEASPPPAHYSFQMDVDQSEVQPNPDSGEIALPDVPTAYCIPQDTPRAAGVVLSASGPDQIEVQVGEQVLTVHYLGLKTDSLRPAIYSAAQAVNETLIGMPVTLVAGEMLDLADGNVWRYVFVSDVFVNYQLLEWGLARASVPANFSCGGFFLAAENTAAEAKAGLWLPEDVRTLPHEWMLAPVVPPISARAHEIYQQGLAMGNDPNAFSVLGDCQSLSWKLFQRLDWSNYELEAEYQYLESIRQHFKGSFGRNSVTTVDGATVASMFSVYWSDPDVCEKNEVPIDCEYRVHNPSFAIISLGTNWTGTPEDFETYLRKIVATSIEQGVLPIISTKPDAFDENWSLNRIMAQVAYDYDIPLWNFWAAVQDLPNNGLKIDDPKGIHFLSSAYPIKRITGLQVLDAVWAGVNAPYP